MGERAYGTATAKPTGGGGMDPNVLDLQESNTVRLIDPGVVAWRQHYVTSAVDPEQGRSVVCPKGADGRDNATCPLCMKNTDENGKQRFSISRRYAVNVWDYESGSVKVLIAGPKVFEEFDAVASVGLDVTAKDFVIHKMGKSINTTYKVVRGDNEAALPVQIGPSDLHDRAKYETPATQERIFEVLQEMGIDYDSLKLPSFTLEEAEAWILPFTKHKGMKIEQVVSQDPEWCNWMHTTKLEGGQTGDPMFIALHTVMEARGMVGPIDEIEAAPPKPKEESTSAEQGTTTPNGNGPAAGLTRVISAEGAELDVPEVALEALLAQGYTQWEEPTPEPETPTEITLVGPNGDEIQAGPDAVEALKAAGFTIKGEEAPAADPEPEFTIPADSDQVQVKVSAVPTPLTMDFKDAKGIVSRNQGVFVDEQLAAAVAADRQDDKAVAQEVAATAAKPDPAGAADVSIELDDLDPKLTTQDDEGNWSHPAIEGTKKSKGAITQALNKLRKKAESNGAVPTSTAPEGSSEALLEQAKNMLANMPELQADFNNLLNLFEEVAGKRQITDFTDDELQKLIVKLEELQSAAATA